MGKKRLNVNKACEYALLKRPEAFHFGESLNFAQSLVKYQADLDKNKKNK
jgi:hypothetical protein